MCKVYVIWGYFRIGTKFNARYRDKHLLFRTQFKMQFGAYSSSTKLQESLGVFVCVVSFITDLFLLILWTHEAISRYSDL